MVEQNWITELEGHPFLTFKHKVKNIKKALTRWSKEIYGKNIKKALTSIDWYVNGDRNTRFFHNLVNERRKRLQVRRIQNAKGSWLDTDNTMAEEAVRFYRHQFTQEQEGENFQILEHISVMVNSGDNDDLCKPPTIEEVKEAVFALK